MKEKVRIAVFASGRGSNARALINYQDQDQCTYEVCAILSNRKNAPVLDLARDHGLKWMSFTKTEFYDSSNVIDFLRENRIDMVVLAGFLWLIPENMIEEFPSRIVNIHPALLPKYGGKGMYGKYVHEAVKANSEDESGMTIHFVNEKYDDGNMIFQARCQLSSEDEASDIAKRVLRLEHHFYPKVVSGVASRLS